MGENLWLCAEPEAAPDWTASRSRWLSLRGRQLPGGDLDLECVDLIPESVSLHSWHFSAFDSLSFCSLVNEK